MDLAEEEGKNLTNLNITIAKDQSNWNWSYFLFFLFILNIFSHLNKEGNLNPPPIDFVNSLFLSLFLVQAKKKLIFIIEPPLSFNIMVALQKGYIEQIINFL